MDFLQIFTLITGVLYIVLEIRQKNFMWVVGIATSLAAMWVFYQKGLYASFGLNTYYFITAFIGLWQWRRDKTALSSTSPVMSSEVGTPPSETIVLNRLSWKTAIISAIITAVGIPALMFLMRWLYDMGLLAENPMSLLDSAVAVLSAVATWWLVKSYREQWWLWIAADTVSTVLCATQGLWWMTALYAAYAVSAIIGYIHWKRHGRYIQ